MCCAGWYGFAVRITPRKCFGVCSGFSGYSGNAASGASVRGAYGKTIGRTLAYRCHYKPETGGANRLCRIWIDAALFASDRVGVWRDLPFYRWREFRKSTTRYIFSNFFSERYSGSKSFFRGQLGFVRSGTVEKRLLYFRRAC